MQDKTIEFVNNLSKMIDQETTFICPLTVKSYIGLSWINTFSTMTPDEILKTDIPKQCYLKIATRYIQATKTKPTDYIISGIGASILMYSSSCDWLLSDAREFMLTWIETFSELPPSKCCICHRKFDFMDIASKFINKTKIKPPAELMSELIPHDLRATEIFVVDWIKIFSELHPIEFMTSLYYMENSTDINYLKIISAFINETKNKPPRDLLSILTTFATNAELTKLYEIWITTFSEFPPESILRRVTRNKELDKPIIAKQKLEKITEITNRLHLDASDNKLMNDLTASLSEIEQILNSN
jgi:hypothetical protein